MESTTKRLTWEKRYEIKDYVLLGCKNMKPTVGLMTKVATKFGLHRSSIYEIWKTMKKAHEDGIFMEVKSKQKENLMPREVLDIARFLLIPPDERHTIRQLAGSYEVSKSKIGRWVKEGILKGMTTKIHPAITERHKIKRLKWYLQYLQINEEGVISYKSQINIVHIDEKWFYMTKLKERFILLPEEEVPYKVAQSKHFIPKIMFICVVGRPLYGPNGELLSDGKYGIWPFTQAYTAKRDLINRPAGTILIKPIPGVNKKAMQDMMFNNIIPAIKEKWPASLSKDIFIQQDNALPHVKNSDADFRKVADSDGFCMNLVQQPAKSPDCNINDLGFFCSIQSIKDKMKAANFEELITAVEMAFLGMDDETLDDVFLTSQMCMTEIMICKGHNDYKKPHMGNDNLWSLGILPRYLNVETKLVMDSIYYLRDMNVEIGNQALMEGLGYEPTQ